jgi:hypothetical protein
MLNIKPVRLELIDGAEPHHARPFPVSQSLEGTTKTEMKILTDIDVLNRSSDSEWAAPTFIQAKKTGDVRILTDFRRLNAQIKRKPFPLPKISDLLRKLSGFKYATAIDLSMGYYHIPLDLEAHKLCKTILPWGKYQYKKLPMDVKTSPDILQRIMYELLEEIPNIQVYLDDILITSNGTFEEHALIMELERLQQANFIANLRKCYSGESKIDYLGYEITRDGIQPQPKKVEARQFQTKMPLELNQVDACLNRFVSVLHGTALSYRPIRSSNGDSKRKLLLSVLWPTSIDGIGGNE